MTTARLHLVIALLCLTGAMALADDVIISPEDLRDPSMRLAADRIASPSGAFVIRLRPAVATDATTLSVASVESIVSVNDALSNTLVFFPEMVARWHPDQPSTGPQALSAWPVEVRVRHDREDVTIAPNFVFELMQANDQTSARTIVSKAISRLVRLSAQRPAGASVASTASTALTTYFLTERELVQADIGGPVRDISMHAVRQAVTTLFLPELTVLAATDAESFAGIVVDDDGNATGSSFAISPSRLITARHVLIQIKKDKVGDSLEVIMGGHHCKVKVLKHAMLGPADLDLSLLESVSGTPAFPVLPRAPSASVFSTKNGWRDRLVFVAGAFAGQTPKTSSGELKVPNTVFPGSFGFLCELLAGGSTERFKANFWPAPEGGLAVVPGAFFELDQAAPIQYLLWRDYGSKPQPVVTHTLQETGQGASGGMLLEFRKTTGRQGLMVVGVYVGLLDQEQEDLGPHVSIPVDMIPSDW